MLLEGSVFKLSKLSLKYRHLLPDIFVFVASFCAALFVRIGNSDWTLFVTLFKLLPIFVTLKLITLSVTGGYNIMWRYLSIKDVARLVRSSVIMTMVLLSATFILNLDRIPRSVYLIDGVLSMIGLIGIRGLRRYAFDLQRERGPGGEAKKILIYGAGSTGIALLKQYAVNPKNGIHVVGFIDDDKAKLDKTISNVNVLGNRTDLPEVIHATGAQEVIIAFKPAPGEVLMDLLGICRPTQVQVRLLSAAPRLRGDMRTLGLTKKIDLADLLNRSSRNIDPAAIGNLIKGKRVLVTGAGGSIGSELCRQIISYNPTQLLLMDSAEFNLYSIDQELRAPTDELGPIVPILGDVKDYVTINRVFETYKPEIVFHAAAYKHVHLVEKNPFTAIVNNVQGTLNLVDAALRFDVTQFVLISTDKAVRPIGVMGATKRLCEMIVAAAGHETGRTFCTVRFGNVLGSSGSFVPLIRKQIEDGDPITITHPEMRRFLMLIPEAVGLVLTSATLASHGDILILRMGDQINILDLVRKLMALYGKSEEENPIIFTGTRPGEKLYEELYLNGNELITDNPDIMIVPKGDSCPETNSFDQMKQFILQLLEWAHAGDDQALHMLRASVQNNSIIMQEFKTSDETQKPHPIH